MPADEQDAVSAASGAVPVQAFSGLDSWRIGTVPQVDDNLSEEAGICQSVNLRDANSVLGCNEEEVLAGAPGLCRWLQDRWYGEACALSVRRKRSER